MRFGISHFAFANMLRYFLTRLGHFEKLGEQSFKRSLLLAEPELAKFRKVARFSSVVCSCNY